MFLIKVRVIIGAMIFLGYFLMYVVRYNLSVHIVDMARLVMKEKIFDDLSNIKRTSITTRFGSLIDILNWDDMKIATLFSAYHIGFCICFPIFHTAGDRLGPTLVVGIAGVMSGVLNCLTPATAYYHFWFLFAVRVVKGFCAGAMHPYMVQVIRHWVPPIERNHFMWAYCGITAGTFSTLMLCALVQYYSTWPLGFYITGVVQTLWALLWVTVVTDEPRKHSFISKEELDYLNHTIGNIFSIKLMNTEAPWRLILKSRAFWALCILNFGYSWMIISMCLHGPMYYSRVVNYNIYNAAILTAVPFLLRFVLGTIAIQTYHWYKHNSNIRKINHIRKYFIILSHVLPGVIVCSSWVTKIIPGPILLSCAVALTAAGMDLTIDLCYELTPNYVNSVNTVIKIIGNTPGIIVSYFVGAVTQKYNNSPFVWKHVWCFHALVLCVSGLIFLMWGETEVQSWNSVKHRPRRPHRALPKASIMSNIIELEEEDYSNQGSTAQSIKKPFLNVSAFRTSQTTS